jgi:hypothetical protein
LLNPRPGVGAVSKQVLLLTLLLLLLLSLLLAGQAQGDVLGPVV